MLVYVKGFVSHEVYYIVSIKTTKKNVFVMA